MKSLWIMHKEVGLTLDATDVMCTIPEGHARLRMTSPSTQTVAPTADEILELYDELHFPSAAKMRATLLKKG